MHWHSTACNGARDVDKVPTSRDKTSIKMSKWCWVNNLSELKKNLDLKWVFFYLLSPARSCFPPSLSLQIQQKKKCQSGCETESQPVSEASSSQQRSRCWFYWRLRHWNLTIREKQSRLTGFISVYTNVHTKKVFLRVEKTVLFVHLYSQTN